MAVYQKWLASLLVPVLFLFIANASQISAQSTTSPIQMKTFMIAYVPPGGIRSLYRGNSLDTSADVINFTKNQFLPAMNNGSKYHGYSNPNSPAQLNYTLANQDIHIENNPPPHTGPNTSDPFDYGGVFNKYNLCNYAKQNDIKMVIIWAGGDGPYWAGQMGESAITGSNGIPTNGPYLSYCPDKTIVVLGLNFTRGLPEALESYGHHLERVNTYFKPEFATWSGASPATWWKLVPYPASNRSQHCGTAHDPPNARWEYDRTSNEIVQTDCRNWKADGSGIKETLNCSAWGCTSDGYLVWWMQNMPSNWWPKFADLDNVSRQITGISVFIQAADDASINSTEALDIQNPQFNFILPGPSSQPRTYNITVTTNYNIGSPVVLNFTINYSPSLTSPSISANCVVSNGDVDHDGDVDLVEIGGDQISDFTIWYQEFLDPTAGKQADFNCDGAVDLIKTGGDSDFTIFYRAFLANP